jgi:Transposase and inactivated derivatives, TnpA family
VVISIQEGKVVPSMLLRKLTNYSRKNHLYQAFRELGCVRGASLGAPNAKQIADRWHLLKNLSETMRRNESTKSQRDTRNEVKPPTTIMIATIKSEAPH